MNTEFRPEHSYMLLDGHHIFIVDVAYMHDDGWALIYHYFDSPDTVCVIRAAQPNQYQEVLPDVIRRYGVMAKSIRLYDAEHDSAYVEVNFTQKTAVWVDKVTGKR